MERMRWWARRVEKAVLPFALIAGLLALILPSGAFAGNSDRILSVLVLTTALGIAPERFPELARSWRLVLTLSVTPFALLAPSAWAISQMFAPPTREGVLSLGLAPTEVAASGLVALAGGDAALALAAVSGSLIFSSIAGPLLLSTFTGAEGAAGGGLVAHFALVVITPLIIGAGARALYPKLGRLEPELSAMSTLTVATLVYASLSGAGGGAALIPALLGSAAFLAVSAAFAIAFAFVSASLVGGVYRATVPLVVGMRDFAVAAALAAQAFGLSAAAVAGVYGVLVLVAGAATATFLRRGR